MLGILENLLYYYKSTMLTWKKGIFFSLKSVIMKVFGLCLVKKTVNTKQFDYYCRNMLI